MRSKKGYNTSKYMLMQFSKCKWKRKEKEDIEKYSLKRKTMPPHSQQIIFNKGNKICEENIRNNYGILTGISELTGLCKRTVQRILILGR